MNPSDPIAAAAGGHAAATLMAAPSSSLTSAPAPPIKRVALTTVSGSVSSAASAASHRSTTAPAATSSSATTSGGRCKTLRFELKLFEPTADSFPEFNYAKLVQIEEKKKKKLAKVTSNGHHNNHLRNGPFDPSDEAARHANGSGGPDHDDDVARIARELERKYGNAYAGKNCGKASASLCYDKGAGYDESDSFIDNTDAYDETVPVEIETDRGGFYINSGSLVFKPLANFERPEDAHRIPKARKRALSTSSEESDNGGDGKPTASQPADAVHIGPVDKKTKLQSEGAGAPLLKAPAAKPSKSAGAQGKEAAPKTTTVKDMLRAKRDSMQRKETTPVVTVAAAASSADDDDDDSGDDSGDGSSESSDDDEDGHINHRNEAEAEAEVEGDDDDDDDDDEEDDEEDDDEEAEAEDEDDVDNDDAVEDVDMEANAAKPTTTATTSAALNGVASHFGPPSAASAATTEFRALPADLPAELLANIARLRDAGTKLQQAQAAAQTAGAGGPAAKCGPLFDAANTELLYRIDCAVRQLQGGQHRNAVYTHLEQHLPCTKQTLQMRAKKCRLQREEAKCGRLVRQLRAAVAATMPAVMAAYEVECKRIADLRAEAQRTDHREQLAALRAPKRRFAWTEETRRLNEQLLVQRRASFAVIRPRKETMEEFVQKYVREVVVPVWPDGFMRAEELVREFEKRQQQHQLKQPINDAGATAASRKEKREKTTATAPKQQLATTSAAAPSKSQVPANSTSLTVPPAIVMPPQAAIVSSSSSALSSSVDGGAERLATLPPTPTLLSATSHALSPAVAPTTPSTPTPTPTIVPTKRSTDHSINSIISPSPPFVPPQTHSATPSPSTTPQPLPPPPPPPPPTVITSGTLVKPAAASPACRSAPIAVVAATANVVEELLSSDSDDVEFIAEFEPTAAPPTQLPKRTAPHGSSSSNSSSATTTTTTTNTTTTNSIISNATATTTTLSPSAVDEKPTVSVALPKQTNVQINRNKYSTKPRAVDGSRSSSPKVLMLEAVKVPAPATADASAATTFAGVLSDVIGAAGAAVVVPSPTALPPPTPDNSDELDVATIMNALKELQKPQPIMPIKQRPLHHHQATPPPLHSSSSSSLAASSSSTQYSSHHHNSNHHSHSTINIHQPPPPPPPQSTSSTGQRRRPSNESQLDPF